MPRGALRYVSQLAQASGGEARPTARGGLAMVLHAHLPFVRHPEHDRFLEEHWLFEAITETYLPLLQVFDGWQRDGLTAPLTLTLSPTLCAMLQDALLQARYRRYLQERIELCEQEMHRVLWEPTLSALARFYRERLRTLRERYDSAGGDLVAAYRALQDQGRLRIATCAATHALLPLLESHPPSLRAQILVARDDYRRCFGCEPSGIWLPECGYSEACGPPLREAGLRWFVTETHGLLHARPRPLFGSLAPVITPAGLAAFGRDPDSARQVWSRHGGFPGDPRYRDFYRDAGFDLDLDYLRPYLAAPDRRGFTGLKYYRITGITPAKEPYDRAHALQAAEEHARHFLAERTRQLEAAPADLRVPPLIVAPYDAELFGHWWFEGPDFLDCLVRLTCRHPRALTMTTPDDYLRNNPTHQLAEPAASSWGEGGYWTMWLNEKSAWLYPHLRTAQERMTCLARQFPQPDPLQERALQQAARELLLAQASDWPFILRTGTSPDYATRRLHTHLTRFTALHDQLQQGAINQTQLSEVESADNLFPNLNYRYWRDPVDS